MLFPVDYSEDAGVYVLFWEWVTKFTFSLNFTFTFRKKSDNFSALPDYISDFFDSGG